MGCKNIGIGKSEFVPKLNSDHTQQIFDERVLFLRSIKKRGGRGRSKNRSLGNYRKAFPGVNQL